MNLFRKNYTLLSDEQLMQRLRQDNSAAFDELYKRYSQRLLAYFYRMLGGDAEKARDFLQDLFFKIIDKHATFRLEAQFSTWIFTLAHNMCKNEYRRLTVRRIMTNGLDAETLPNPSSDSVNIEQKIDHKQFTALLNRELEKVDKNQRSSFLLRFQAQLSIKEISEILGCSEGTTKSRLFYVTKKLANVLRDFNPYQNEETNHVIE